jgi:hypothetical protein
MNELQNFVNGFGFGITVNELASKAYWHMKGLGHDVCIINDRYLEVDGSAYSFGKSQKQGRWIIKKF